MGIRIGFQVVIGINDAVKNDPRYVPADSLVGEDLEAEVPAIGSTPFLDQGMWGGFFNGKYMYNVGYNLHVHNEFCVEGIVGYVLDRTSRGDEVSYALAVCFEQFREDGYMIFPVREPNVHERYILKRDEDDDERKWLEAAIEENRLIRYEQAFMTSAWFDLAMHVLHCAGWTGIDRSMLKIMLVWDWA